VSGSEEAEGSLPTFRKVWSGRGLYMEALVTLISKEIEGYYLQGKEAERPARRALASSSAFARTRFSPGILPPLATGSTVFSTICGRVPGNLCLPAAPNKGYQVHLIDHDGASLEQARSYGGQRSLTCVALASIQLAGGRSPFGLSRAR